MASLLGESLFETNGQGPPPGKDYYQFTITKKEVIWRTWKISLRSEFRNARPGELRESHADYLDDSRLQGHVRVVFGVKMLEYSRSLCRGDYDYLERLPDTLLLRILSHLELEDVAKLRLVSRKLRQLCDSEEFWEQAVRSRCGPVSPQVVCLARELGWRRVFFTSKLQLQKLLSRRRRGARTQVHSTDILRQILSDMDTGSSPSPDPGSDPSPDPDPGSDPSPDPGSDPSPDPGSDPSPDPDPGPYPSSDPGPDPLSRPYVEPSEDQGGQAREAAAHAEAELSPEGDSDSSSPDSHVPFDGI